MKFLQSLGAALVIAALAAVAGSAVTDAKVPRDSESLSSPYTTTLQLLPLDDHASLPNGSHASGWVWAGATHSP